MSSLSCGGTLGLPYPMTAQHSALGFLRFVPPPSQLNRCDWLSVMTLSGRHANGGADWLRPPDLGGVPAFSPAEDRLNMAASLRCFLRSGKVWASFEMLVLSDRSALVDD